MCPQVSEKLKRIRKSVIINVKLNIIKHFDCDKWKDVCIELVSVHHLYYLHRERNRERILKAAEVTISSASIKVISFTWHPGMDKIESVA